MCELVLNRYMEFLGLDNLLYALMLVYGFFLGIILMKMIIDKEILLELHAKMHCNMGVYK